MKKQPLNSIALPPDFYSEIEAISATFSQRMIARRKAMQLSQRDLAQIVDVSINTIQSYEAGGLPRGANFLALARALACSLNWLVGMDDVGGFSCQIDSGNLPCPGNLPGDVNNSDYFVRPEFLNDANDDVDKCRAMGFNSRWLAEISSQPKNLRLFFFKGPAMQPTLNDGDLAMVDLGQTKIHSGYLYLIKIGDTQSVNRLIIKPGNCLSVVSDNHYLCPSFDLSDNQLEVLGRIIWASRPL